MLSILISIGTAIAKPFKWYWFKASPKLKAVIAAILLLIAVAGYIAYLRYSVQKLEREVIETNLNNDLENVNRILEEANKREANFNASANEANRVRNANFNNTSGAEGDRLRCLAYPERCRK